MRRAASLIIKLLLAFILAGSFASRASAQDYITHGRSKPSSCTDTHQIFVVDDTGQHYKCNGATFDPLNFGGGMPVVTGQKYGESYASLDAARSAIGATNTVLMIVQPLACGASSVTIPSTLSLVFFGAGQITGTCALDLSATPLSAGPTQIFANTVTPSFGANKLISDFRPQWFGVVGDGSTNDAAALARLLAAQPDNSGAYQWDGLRMALAATVTWTGRADVTWRTGHKPMDGTDAHAPAFIWTGSAGGTMFNLDGTGHCTIDGFLILPGTANKAFTIDKVSASRISTDNFILNNSIYNSTNNPSFFAIQLGATAAGNVEFNHVEHNYIQCSNQNPGVGTGLDVGRSGSFQSKNNSVIENGFNQCGTGVNVISGSVQQTRNHSSTNDWEVRLELSAGDGNVVEEGNYESCKHCFYVDAANGTTRILGNRIYGTGTPAGVGLVTVGAHARQLEVAYNSIENLPAGAKVFDGSASAGVYSTVHGNRMPSATITKAQANYSSLCQTSLGPCNLFVYQEANVSDLAENLWFTGDAGSAVSLTATNIALNGTVKVNGSDVSTIPRIRATNSGAQSIPDSASTAITFDTNDASVNVGAMHSTSVNTSRITFTMAGLYAIGASLDPSFAAGGSYRVLEIKRNGASLTPAEYGVDFTSQIQPQVHASTIYYFSAGDYIEAFYSQVSGSAQNIQRQQFWAYRISN